jgi:ferritin
MFNGLAISLLRQSKDLHTHEKKVLKFVKNKIKGIKFNTIRTKF